jgi:ApbE superfamily uncharacterized protein (UPF0280 family)
VETLEKVAADPKAVRRGYEECKILEISPAVAVAGSTRA